MLALSRRSSHCSPARHCSLGRRSDARHPPPHSAGLFREGLRRPAPGPAGWLRWRSKADSCTKHSIWCNRQGDCTLRHQIKLFGAVVAFTALSFGGSARCPPLRPRRWRLASLGGPRRLFCSGCRRPIVDRPAMAPLALVLCAASPAVRPPLVALPCPCSCSVPPSPPLAFGGWLRRGALAVIHLLRSSS